MMLDPVEAVFQSVEAFYRRVYWQAPTATSIWAAGYTLSYSGVAWLHSVNHLWLHDRRTLLARNEAAEPLADWLQAAEQFFRPFGADFNVVFSDSERFDGSDQLTGCGYVERLRSPILALDGLPRITTHNRHARIVRVTEADKRDLLHVLYDAFYLGPELSRCIVRPDQLCDPATRHYLAYVNEEPACCATVLLGADGVAGVWNVGTVRQFRRHGLASTVMAQALSEAAADGCPVSALLASPMGRPLYESMGYRCVGNTIYYGPAEVPYW
ncbi:MAG: GNAT family N-acetyltransferase [Aggregatilineales bacterium]